MRPEHDAEGVPQPREESRRGPQQAGDRDQPHGDPAGNEGVHHRGRDRIEARDEVEDRLDELVLGRRVADRESDHGRYEEQERRQGEERPIREGTRMRREFVILVARRDRSGGIEDEPAHRGEPGNDPLHCSEDPRRGRLRLPAFPARVVAHERSFPSLARAGRVGARDAGRRGAGRVAVVPTGFEPVSPLERGITHDRGCPRASGTIRCRRSGACWASSRRSKHRRSMGGWYQP